MKVTIIALLYLGSTKKNQTILTIQKVEVPCKKIIDHLYYIKNAENIY